MSKKENNECIIFIYNADSGAINAIRDYFQKLLLPKTYECNLCAVTYGNFGMKREWMKYIKDLSDDISIEFLHKDEFEEHYPEISDAKYPSAYYIKNKNYEIFISQEEMNSVKSISELKQIVDKKLKLI